MIFIFIHTLNFDHPLNQTFAEADADKDGKISKADWKAFVKQRPLLLRHMTLPYLKYISHFCYFIFEWILIFGITTTTTTTRV